MYILCYCIDRGYIETYSLVDAKSGEVYEESLECDLIADTCEFEAPFMAGDLEMYTIVANTVGDYADDPIQSVKMCIDGACRCENSAPYSLFGDGRQGYTGQPLEAGTYIVEGTIYRERGCNGDQMDEPKTLTLTVVDDVVDPGPTAAPSQSPTAAPSQSPTANDEPVDLFAHCEQPIGSLPYQISIQELQSPAGPRHSEGILSLSAGDGAGQDVGLVWFSNDIVEPIEGQFKGDVSMGSQSGHCVLVEEDSLLACYFNFNVQTADKMGRITAEALFDLTNFPNANLVITGGTGDFTGIKGAGCTTTVPGFDFDFTTFIYHFTYDL